MTIDIDELAFFFELPFFFGTFAPERRASDRPIAMACLRLFTFLPDRPLFSVPRLRSCIARFTLLCAFLPYFAMPRSSLRDPRTAPGEAVQAMCPSRQTSAPAARPS